jgi:hypothetical protein
VIGNSRIGFHNKESHYLTLINYGLGLLISHQIKYNVKDYIGFFPPLMHDRKGPPIDVRFILKPWPQFSRC